MLELRLWTIVQKQMVTDTTLENDLLDLAKNYREFQDRFGVIYHATKKTMLLSNDPLNQFKEIKRIMEIEENLMVRTSLYRQEIRKVARCLEKVAETGQIGWFVGFNRREKNPENIL